MSGSALREAATLAVDEALVSELLDPGEELDRRFRTAWRKGLQALPARLRRGALPGITGHVAESLVEVTLLERGYVAIGHHASPGRHGVDLVMLHLDSEMVFAIEVKGTLRAGHLPWLSAGELRQMSVGWLDKPDNPTMAAPGLGSADVYGAVVTVNFADMQLRAAMSRDFAAFEPVRERCQLDDPSWLAATDGGGGNRHRSRSAFLSGLRE
jgi:hypothetical protein